MPRAAPGPLLGPLLGSVLAVSACGGDRDVYSMRGQPYDADADCLGPSEIIDVVEGPAPDPCDGYRCLRSVESGELFISAHCGAPPGWTEEDPATVPECAAAQAAKDLAEDGLCP